MTGRHRRGVALLVVGTVVAALAVVNAAPRLLVSGPDGPDGLGTRAHDTVLQPRWTAPVTGWPAALGADARGAVVVAGGGEVGALGRDGSVRWRAAVPGAGLHPPDLTPDQVLVGARDRVVALDRANGALEWQVDAPDGDVGPVTAAGSVVVYGTETGALVAIDAAGGEPRWSVRHPGAVRSAPVATRGLVGVAWHGGGDPQLRVLDVATGALRWTAPLLTFASAPVLAGDAIVVAEGDGDWRARVVARRVADGAEAWTATMPASFESGITPGAAGDAIAVVDHFGTVSVLDRTTGAVLEQIALDTPVLHTTVVLTEDAVVLTTYDGELVVADQETGRVLHRGDPGGHPIATARSGPYLLVALRLTDPGRVAAYRVH